MNDRIKKKKRKQKEAILNLLSFSKGIYEWGIKSSSSIKELSVAMAKFRDCAGKLDSISLNYIEVRTSRKFSFVD